MGLYRLDDMAPRTPENGEFWVADSAVVLGNVELSQGTNIWFGATIRGDNEPIRIGARSNVQENSVLHTDPGFPMTIGDGVTVGHMVMLHGCTIGDNSLIGIGAIVLNGARIGRDCLIGAGALVTEGKEIPDGSVVFGAPGKVVRQVTDADKAMLARAADNYDKRWRRYKAGFRPVA